MSRFLTLIFTVIGLLVAGGLGFAYVTDRIEAGTLVFLTPLVVVLFVVVGIFVRRMTHPEASMAQTLYKSEHHLT